MNYATEFVVCVLLVLVVVGGGAICYNIRPQTPPQGFKYAIEVIDGCEYLRFFSGNNYEAITHKGNCKNHEQ